MKKFAAKSEGPGEEMEDSLRQLQSYRVTELYMLFCNRVSEFFKASVFSVRTSMRLSCTQGREGEWRVAFLGCYPAPQEIQKEVEVRSSAFRGEGRPGGRCWCWA